MTRLGLTCVDTDLLKSRDGSDIQKKPLYDFNKQFKISMEDDMKANDAFTSFNAINSR